MKRAVLVVAVVLAACSSGTDDPVADPARPTTTLDSTTTTEPVASVAADAAAEVDDVYAVPDPLPEGEPGDVIQVEPLGPVDGADGAEAWRVLYHSRSIDDEDIAVSGIVVRPGGEAPEGGFPVVTWAHGTTGTADECAPSKAERPAVPLLADLLAAGYVVAATDYQGLGTPGLHPYLLGESEGRGVLDAARAAAELEGADAGSTVVVWGHSQGGHAALFAGEVAPRYAPELDVRGVVAIAPAGDLTVIGPAVFASTELFGFAFLVFGTWAQEYPELDLAELFAPATLELLPLLDEACTEEVFAAVGGRLPADQLVTDDPMGVGPVAELLEANSAGRRPLAGPYLVAQGEADALVPLGLTQALLPVLCDAGADAELRTYPGATHGSVLAAAAADMLAWTADRFAGVPPAPGACES